MAISKARQFDGDKLVIATHNPGKAREIADLVSPYCTTVILASRLGLEKPEECGVTFVENAELKALVAAESTGLPALADDSGLVVAALGGDPGIYSARYAGEKCSYSDNVNKLLQEMDNISSDKRIAHFCTAIAYVDDNMELTTKGTVQGLITDKRKGIDGFGYDPVFYVPNMKKTYAEMSMNEKNQISHRGKAVKNMQILLQPHLPKIFQQMEDIA